MFDNRRVIEGTKKMPGKAKDRSYKRCGVDREPGLVEDAPSSLTSFPRDGPKSNPGWSVEEAHNGVRDPSNGTPYFFFPRLAAVAPTYPVRGKRWPG